MNFKQWFQEQTAMDNANTSQAQKMRVDAAKQAMQKHIETDPKAAEEISKIGKVPTSAQKANIIKMGATALRKDPAAQQSAGVDRKPGLPAAMTAISDIQQGIQKNLNQ